VPISAYRIVKTKWAAFAFDGEGARRNGGRWNSVGTRMVYTAESRSLAALEVLVHLEGPARGYSLIRCDIPDDISVELVADGDLPADWQDSLSPPALATLGDAWVVRGSTAVLKVRSAVVHGEYDYLLNPVHSEFDRIRIHTPEPFLYDARLVALIESKQR
jgi:RES domain-containing protein